MNNLGLQEFEWDSITHHAITARLFSCAQFCSRGIGDYGCLPACRILDRTNCSSFTGQDLLCSLLQQRFQQYFPLMVFRLHLSKPRFALNGISTRTVKCGEQDAFGNRVDCYGQWGQATTIRLCRSLRQEGLLRGAASCR